MQQNYTPEYQLQSGSGLLLSVCAMHDEIWIAGDMSGKLFHQALAQGKVQVLLVPIKRKGMSHGDDAAISPLKVVLKLCQGKQI